MRTATRPRFASQLFGNTGFLICVALLLSFAVGFRVLHRVLGFQDIKQRLDPRKPLSELDAKKLAGYELLHAYQLKPEILDTLGTTLYIQWTLKEDVGPRIEPEHLVHLFVTYYTGVPDQVPHVPEECYYGSGYEIRDASFMEVPIPALGPEVVVPVQIVRIGTPTFMGSSTRIVMYTFHTNGQFCSNRRCVQQAVGDPAAPYAYFSKLEVTFGFPDALPPEDKAIAAGVRFLQKVVPVLVTDHWPDWDKAVREAQPAATRETQAPKAGSDLPRSN